MPRIKRFCLMFLFSLNKITKAIPALTINPATKAPKPIPPIEYRFVITTELAQFGISPIKAETNGVKPLLFSKKLAILSSPSHSISPLKIRFIMNIKANIFNVWISG